MAGTPFTHDVLCLSHLPWRFVYQRPQHLMTRCARSRRVFYLEEPVTGSDRPYLQHFSDQGVEVLTPHVPDHLSTEERHSVLRGLVDDVLARSGSRQQVLWYQTPAAVTFTRHLHPAASVYDCMDEMAGEFARPGDLREAEIELLRRVDLVFTGGYRLFEAKRYRHPAVYPFPGGVEPEHFAVPPEHRRDPDDQADIQHPRIGFFGVLDERLDLELIRGVAKACPGWHIVLVGPVVGIEHRLPHRANIHYLGPKRYEQLPQYVAGWDVAIMPFARNRATEFISPTKPLEYLAAGKPVVSTSVRDVVRSYGNTGVVRIADTVDEMVEAVRQSLMQEPGRHGMLIDALLRRFTWDRIWAEMEGHITHTVDERERYSGGGVPSTAVTV